MFLSGHLANWEMMPITGAADRAWTAPPWCARPTIPMSRDWVARQRAHQRPRRPDRQAHAARAHAAQLRGGKIALHAGGPEDCTKASPCPFFGRDAMTTPAPAALALKTGRASVSPPTGGCRARAFMSPSGRWISPQRRRGRRHPGLTAAITAGSRRWSAPIPANGCGFTSLADRARRRTDARAKHEHAQAHSRQLFFGRDPLKDFPHDRFASDLQGWHSSIPI